MSSDTVSTTSQAPPGNQPATCPRPRLTIRIDGSWDDVSADVGENLAALAQVLLVHSDGHSEGRARMRIARLGRLLNVWLTDSACSPECMARQAGFPAADGPVPYGEARIMLSRLSEGGLTLHWARRVG